MIRTAIVFIALSSLAGLLFYGWQDYYSARFEAAKKLLDARVSEDGAVAYAVSDIKKGTAIKPDSFEMRMLPQNKVPRGAVCDLRIAIGRRTKHEITAGQILRNDNLELPDDFHR